MCIRDSLRLVAAGGPQHLVRAWDLRCRDALELRGAAPRDQREAGGPDPLQQLRPRPDRLAQPARAGHPAVHLDLAPGETLRQASQPPALDLMREDEHRRVGAGEGGQAGVVVPGLPQVPVAELPVAELPVEFGDVAEMHGGSAAGPRGHPGRPRRTGPRHQQYQTCLPRARDPLRTPGPVEALRMRVRPDRQPSEAEAASLLQHVLVEQPTDTAPDRRGIDEQHAELALGRLSLQGGEAEDPRTLLGDRDPTGRHLVGPYPQLAPAGGEERTVVSPVCLRPQRQLAQLRRLALPTGSQPPWPVHPLSHLSTQGVWP